MEGQTKSSVLGDGQFTLLRDRGPGLFSGFSSKLTRLFSIKEYPGRFKKRKR
jgi:hypothetical protein